MKRKTGFKFGNTSWKWSDAVSRKPFSTDSSYISQGIPHPTGWPGVTGISLNLGHIYKKQDSPASEQSATENQQNKCSYDSSFAKLLLKFTVLQFEGLVI